MAPQPGLPARQAGEHGRLDDPGAPPPAASYFAREVLGLHPRTSRLLLCTDGGHYETLGLVELLRHRCRLIYCNDASGDTPPLATTLAQAITLAEEELGVRITLRDPLPLVPGAAVPQKPESPLADLNARLSATVVCVGDITYPNKVAYPREEDDGGYENNRGTLILAKSNLTPEEPYELLPYALENSSFPRDGTADQWFDVGQFDAYRRLDEHLGAEAYEAAKREGAIDAGGRPIPPGPRGEGSLCSRLSRRLPFRRGN